MSNPCLNTTNVAVVTGANKGIGFAIVKGLCQSKDFVGNVYLTARDPIKGEQAVNELKKLGLNPKFHQLDISDERSVQMFRNYIMTTYGGIDILINNAGYQIFRPYKESLINVTEKTMNANYVSLKNLLTDLTGVLRFNARIITTSGGFGHLSHIPGENIRNALANPCLTIEGLDSLLENFKASVRRGTHIVDGWGDDPYKISKAFVVALTFIFHRGLIFTNMKFNTTNPGYVNTDMTKHMGILTPDQGAEVAIYTALNAPNNIRGRFIWADKQPIQWNGPIREYA